MNLKDTNCKRVDGEFINFTITKDVWLITKEKIALNSLMRFHSIIRVIIISRPFLHKPLPLELILVVRIKNRRIVLLFFLR